MFLAVRASIAVAGVLAAHSVIAQDPASPVTLGEWIARDRMVGTMDAGAQRDGELAVLHGAVVQSLQAARAVQDAKRSNGQTPDACLPPPGQAQMTSSEVGAWLYARPAGEHGDPLDAVFTRFLAERFPCP
jgi:hypothetical protein